MIGWAITGVGMLCIAFVFQALATRKPHLDSGVYSYVRAGLGVGLLVMQVGAYLMPALGTKEALLAIVAGSLLGAGLLGWVAKLGADSGLASAGARAR